MSGRNRSNCRVPAERPESDDHANSCQRGEFPNQVREAVVPLDDRRPIHRWRATDGGGEVGIAQDQAVIGPNGRWLVGEAGRL